MVLLIIRCGYRKSDEKIHQEDEDRGKSRLVRRRQKKTRKERRKPRVRTANKS